MALTMKILRDQQRAFGGTGLSVPPIAFGTAALGNVSCVVPDQTKLAICGEWFRGVEPPVLIDVAYGYGNGMALEVLGRALRRLDIASAEIVICLNLGCSSSRDVAERPNYAQINECWAKSCRLLGDAYQPKLVSISDADEEAWRAVSELKAAGSVRGVGLVASDLRAAKEQARTIDLDWITLAGGCTLMRHSPEVFAVMAELAERQIPLIVAGVFDGGFLAGDNQLDGRTLNPDDPANRTWFAWRKAFVALCDGHGISPAQACIQFSLSAPGVVAVLLDSSYPDRVAANIESVRQEVPENFWASLREEGLLVTGFPGAG
ncbi:MAG: aldo/keto reductase [Burkholderiales bacterium]